MFLLFADTPRMYTEATDDFPLDFLLLGPDVPDAESAFRFLADFLDDVSEDFPESDPCKLSVVSSMELGSDVGESSTLPMADSGMSPCPMPASSSSATHNGDTSRSSNLGSTSL